MDPDAARIVTVEMTGEPCATAPTLEDGDGFDCCVSAPPPPQLCAVIATASTRHNAPTLGSPLRPPPTMTPASGSTNAQRIARDAGSVERDGIKLATDAAVEIVRVALA